MKILPYSIGELEIILLILPLAILLILFFSITSDSAHCSHGLTGENSDTLRKVNLIE
jgi:hypothetical protein